MCITLISSLRSEGSFIRVHYIDIMVDVAIVTSLSWLSLTLLISHYYRHHAGAVYSKKIYIYIIRKMCVEDASFENMSDIITFLAEFYEKASQFLILNKP